VVRYSWDVIVGLSLAGEKPFSVKDVLLVIRPHVLMLPRSSLNVLRISLTVSRNLIGRGGGCE
jgi:hypothetical protein